MFEQAQLLHLQCCPGLKVNILVSTLQASLSVIQVANRFTCAGLLPLPSCAWPLGAALLLLGFSAVPPPA